MLDCLFDGTRSTTSAIEVPCQNTWLIIVQYYHTHTSATSNSFLCLFSCTVVSSRHCSPKHCTQSEHILKPTLNLKVIHSLYICASSGHTRNVCTTCHSPQTLVTCPLATCTSTALHTRNINLDPGMCPHTHRNCLHYLP